MQRYLGIDIHSKSATVSVLDPSGKELRRDVVETNGAALIGYVKRLAGEVHLCLEESEWSGWLHEILAHRVAELVVLHPQWKAGAKSDAIDAKQLAERLRSGQTAGAVFKAPRQFARLRELARTYRMLTVDAVRVKNRLRSAYRRRAIAYPGHGLEAQERGLASLPAAMRQGVEALATELSCIEQLRGEVEEAMVGESHRHPIARILETAPGLGPIRVAQLVPIIVTPHRFRTKRQLWAYCGFGVVTRSSADWRQVDGQWVRARFAQARGLNRNHNRTLKAIFKGAAVTVVRSRTQPLWASYQRLLENGTKPNLAQLTLARRIAAIVLAMWKQKARYDPQRP